MALYFSASYLCLWCELCRRPLCLSPTILCESVQCTTNTKDSPIKVPGNVKTVVEPVT